MLCKLSIAILMIAPIFLKAQTCIVAVKSKDKIVVGADSRVSQPGIYNNEATETYADTACKIVFNGQFGIAYEGAGGPQCMNAARYALYTFSSPSKITNCFKSITSALIERYEDSLLVRPDLATQQYLEKLFPIGMNKLIGAIFFFGYQADSIIFETYYLQRIVGIDGRYHDVWNQYITPDTTAIGLIKELDASRILHNKSTWAKGVVPGIISAINYSHQYNPTHVGGPVDIIEVTVKKYRWLQKKKICN